ncbi:MAG: NUDIX hydrolase [Candidatus Blackburnbacteria bacterium]|nr:NUDIX hydrolase [Candidatus Blackburnbacteria bacterium]
MSNVTQTTEWKGGRFVVEWAKTRSLKGISPVTQVYGVCFNDKNEILIARKVGEEKWIIPGGHPERDETIEQALKREMVEEADIRVKNIKLIGAQKVYPEGEPDKYFYQVRCICKVDKVLPQTTDPDDGVSWERKFVPASEITSYVKWGTTGNAMFKDAIQLAMC